MDTVEFALACYRTPLAYQEHLSLSASLPDDMGYLLRLAIGSPKAIEEATGRTNAKSQELQAAARFCIQQLCLAPGSSYHRILGVQPNASQDQIREHHRLLMRLFHPDHSAGRETWTERYAARINEAWTALSRLSQDTTVHDHPSDTPSSKTVKPLNPNLSSIVFKDEPRKRKWKPSRFSVLRHRLSRQWLPKLILASLVVVNLLLLGRVYLIPPFASSTTSNSANQLINSAGSSEQPASFKNTFDKNEKAALLTAKIEEPLNHPNQHAKVSISNPEAHQQAEQTQPKQIIAEEALLVQLQAERSRLEKQLKAEQLAAEQQRKAISAEQLQSEQAKAIRVAAEQKYFEELKTQQAQVKQSVEQLRSEATILEQTKLEQAKLIEQAKLENARLEKARLTEQAKLDQVKQEQLKTIEKNKLEQANAEQGRRKQITVEETLLAQLQAERSRLEKQLKADQLAAEQKYDELKTQHTQTQRLTEQLRSETANLEKTKLEQAKLVEQAKLENARLEQVRLAEQAKFDQIKQEQIKILEQNKLEQANLAAATLRSGQNSNQQDEAHDTYPSEEQSRRKQIIAEETLLAQLQTERSRLEKQLKTEQLAAEQKYDELKTQHTQTQRLVERLQSEAAMLEKTKLEQAKLIEQAKSEAARLEKAKLAEQTKQEQIKIIQPKIEQQAEVSSAKPILQQDDLDQDKSEVENDSQPTLSELEDLMSRYAQAYQLGRLNNIMALFMPANENNQAYRDRLRKDYMTLFNDHRIRGLQLRDVRWTYQSELASGTGRYEVSLQRRNGGEQIKAQGNIHFKVRKQNQRALIEEIEYDWSTK